MLRFLAATAVVATVLAGSSHAQELTWGDWDGNSDGQVDQDEFSAGMQKHGAFARWDSDGDKRLSEEEFERGMFRDYDVNSDDAILHDEAGMGIGMGLGIGLGAD
jgi:hypothetical protein